MGDGDYFRYLHNPDGAKWKGVEDSFGRIADRMDDECVPVLLVIVPFVTKSKWEWYRYADLHEQVARAGRSAGFDVLDLLPAYMEYPPARLCIDGYDEHPSPLGHRVAAEAIRDRLFQKHSEALFGR